MRVRRTKTSKLGFRPSGVLAWLTSACAWTWTRMLSDAPSMGMGTLVAYAPVEMNTATSSILIELFIGSPGVRSVFMSPLLEHYVPMDEHRPERGVHEAVGVGAPRPTRGGRVERERHVPRRRGHVGGAVQSRQAVVALELD